MMKCLVAGNSTSQRCNFFLGHKKTPQWTLSASTAAQSLPSSKKQRHKERHSQSMVHTSHSFTLFTNSVNSRSVEKRLRLQYGYTKPAKSDRFYMSSRENVFFLLFTLLHNQHVQKCNRQSAEFLLSLKLCFDGVKHAISISIIRQLKEHKILIWSCLINATC